MAGLLRGGQEQQLVGQRVVDGDRLAVLVDALIAQCPGRHHRGPQTDRPTGGEVVAYRAQDELRHPAGGVLCQAEECVCDRLVGEALEERADVVVQIDPRHRAQGGPRLALKIGPHPGGDIRICRGLVRVLDPQQPPPVGQPLVGGVEKTQLHELVGDDVVDHLHPDLLPRGSPGGEVVLDHPLGEGLADHRPGVLHTECPPQLGDVGPRGARGDAVHHAAGEGDVPVDPVRQIGVAHRGLADHRRAGRLPVTGQVVAAHDRQRSDPRLPATPQRLNDVAEGGRRLAGVLGVVDGSGCLSAERAGGVVNVVAALGDRQRDDPGGRCAQEGQDGLGVVGGEEVVVDRADDRWIAQPTGMLEQQGVEVVLSRQHVTHPGVPGQQADAADPPLQAGAARCGGCSAAGAGPGAPAHEPVEVGGLVGAVEAAHTDVDDPGGHGGAVVVGGQG